MELQKQKCFLFLPAIYFGDTRQRQSKRRWLSLCRDYLINSTFQGCDHYLDSLKQALPLARLLAKQLAIKRFFWRFELPFDAFAEGHQGERFLDKRERLV